MSAFLSADQWFVTCLACEASSNVSRIPESIAISCDKKS